MTRGPSDFLLLLLTILLLSPTSYSLCSLHTTMPRPPRLLLVFTLLLSSLTLSLAACKHRTALQHWQDTHIYAASTSFCKCTCFSNSTIIQLDGSSSPNSGSSKPDAKKTRGTCSDCNKAFCLSYNLPICKGAKEEDVFTTCFQRDSAKDEAVVFIFIGATTALLVYAAVRPWVEKWSEVRYEVVTESRRERRRRITLS